MLKILPVLSIGTHSFLLLIFTLLNCLWDFISSWWFLINYIICFLILIESNISQISLQLTLDLCITANHAYRDIFSHQ